MYAGLLSSVLGGPSERNTYLKSGGRRKFQIDLAVELFSYGLLLDWDGALTTVAQATCVSKDTFTPCDCKKSYFCKLGHTGVARGVDKNNASPYSTTNAAVAWCRRVAPMCG